MQLVDKKSQDIELILQYCDELAVNIWYYVKKSGM